jgi:hypothetical protein
MSLGTVVLLVVMLMLVGILPMWQHASRWGIRPSVAVGTALAALVVLFITGRL